MVTPPGVGGAGHLARGGGLRSYRDQTGWSVLYPADFRVEVSEQELGLAQAEVTFANFTAQPGIVVRVSSNSGNVCAVPPLALAGRFPADGVALRLLSDSGAPTILISQPRSQLPLSLASFRPSQARPACSTTPRQARP